MEIAAASQEDKAAPICILGMHRSGTSCLAGSLQQAGLRLGEVVTAAPYNRKGNRESEAVRTLNDSILAHSGGAWDRPPDQLRWTVEHEARLAEIASELGGQGPWGFKDPRTLLTLPFWVAGLPELRFVGTFRHPVAVARSLVARRSLPVGRKKALALWVDYNTRLLDLWEKAEFPLISFDLPPDRYLGRLNSLVGVLGLQAAGANRRESEFFDPSLRRQHGTRKRLWEKRLAEEPTMLHARLRTICEEQASKETGE